MDGASDKEPGFENARIDIFKVKRAGSSAAAEVCQRIGEYLPGNQYKRGKHGGRVAGGVIDVRPPPGLAGKGKVSRSAGRRMWANGAQPVKNDRLLMI